MNNLIGRAERNILVEAQEKENIQGNLNSPLSRNNQNIVRSHGGPVRRDVDSKYHVGVPDVLRSTCEEVKHVVVLVGLPARGKSYTALKIRRFFNWIGMNTEIFNLGDVRRELSNYEDCKIFDAANDTGLELRERACRIGLERMFEFLEKTGDRVAVFDGTNSTQDRRKRLHDEIVVRKGYKLLFLELICDDKDRIDKTIRESKTSNADYEGLSSEEAVSDFEERISMYEQSYETIGEEENPEYSFVKIMDLGRGIVTRNCDGFVPIRIVHLFLHVRSWSQRTIFLTRPGETVNNLKGSIGGDSELTPRGRKYARQLKTYLKNAAENGDGQNLMVWTSCAEQAHQTVQDLDYVKKRFHALGDLDAGNLEGLTYARMKASFPSEFNRREQDKFLYRYPKGNSYCDLVERLQPVVMELEKRDPVVVVANHATLRCLLGYFLEEEARSIPYLEIPLHTLIRLEPTDTGCRAVLIKFPVDCVSTHRGKGNNSNEFLKKFPTAEKERSKLDDKDDEVWDRLESKLLHYKTYTESEKTGCAY